MTHERPEIEFTGEFFVPGISGDRIEADHLERYIFATKFAKNKTILDIACGTGYSAPLFINAGAKSYHGVDIGHEQINYAIARYAEAQINYEVSDICLFNPGNTFDLIVCFETIEHIKQYHEALLNLYNLLNNGGQLLISSPNRPITSPRAKHLSDKPENAFHTQEFTPNELISSLRKAGFHASKNCIYGQRQRFVFPVNAINVLRDKIYGDADYNSSPKVSPVTLRSPRYFIIAANKQDRPRPEN